ncbi:unnamed protein product [Notodromas monacha]|uniref:Haloacid dehalogenase-like hydrolase domain-containing 5 n=1 Tax=Notodromas monacha TaxID=399045 RepID=A0A7R9GFJ5_9CRUS|nr:unnamed protein product [Notodromas monacha]CAG0919402.1 unnamed protein product [Notodromas monacha]
MRPPPSFGLLFDIDGVLVRGKKVLPVAPKAFSKLIDGTGNFRVPTVFLTNSGNSLRSQKAQQLTKWLGVPIHEDQVVMAHSPLRMFKEFHNKKVLVSGQGPVREIAANLGFKHIVTIDEFSNAFPMLDSLDHNRSPREPNPHEERFPAIESVVLFGEPIRWEVSLQLIVDALTTNGKPCPPLPKKLPYPHIPILACNTDLHWMAEACLPRFGHGAFLVCLENLYKKITGHELIYTALIGKPSEITYHHAERMVLEHAISIGCPGAVKTLYCIGQVSRSHTLARVEYVCNIFKFSGDNVNTDIFGANLYDKYLRRVWSGKNKPARQSILQIARRGVHHFIEDEDGPQSSDFTAERCYSILVQTGVFGDHTMSDSEHSPRDFLPVEESLRQPNFVSENVYRAVELVFEREKFA